MRRLTYKMFVCRLHGRSVAYAATSLGAVFMNSVFVFYYVKVYLNRFHVSESWFQLSQVIFLVWNAINDPLFGYIQDNMKWLAVARTRRHSILYGAPLFALSFILPWFPWADYTSSSAPWISGVQLLVILCFYDALFTFVLLAQCALFAEMSLEHEDRVRLVRYSQVAALLGSTSVYITDAVSEGLLYYGRFQLTCVLIALVSCACFVYTGLHGHTKFDDDAKLAGADKTSLLIAHPVASQSSSPDTHTGGDELSMWRQTVQIFSQRSFVSFILTNLLQIYHTTFLANFTSIVCDRLIPDSVLPSQARSALYGAMFFLPPILVIIGTPVVSRLGYFRVIRFGFIIHICSGVALYIMGPQSYYIIALFFLIGSACSNATFSLFGLCLSDIIDVDKERYHRKHYLSSMVFGLNALVTKPAISLAPMITVAIFNRHGYATISAAANNHASEVTSSIFIADNLGNGAIDQTGLTSAMFLTVCAVPVVIGTLQLIVWSFYTIRDSHKSSYRTVIV